jgi:hypothetical protein
LIAERKQAGFPTDLDEALLGSLLRTQIAFERHRRGSRPMSNAALTMRLQPGRQPISLAPKGPVISSPLPGVLRFLPAHWDAKRPKVERDIADGQKRIERQRALIAELEARGERTGQAQSLLTALIEVLATLERHRDLMAAGVSQVNES